MGVYMDFIIKNIIVLIIQVKHQIKHQINEYNHINKLCKKVQNYHFINHYVYNKLIKIMMNKQLSKLNILTILKFYKLNNIIKNFISPFIINKN